MKLLVIIIALVIGGAILYFITKSSSSSSNTPSPPPSPPVPGPSPSPSPSPPPPQAPWQLPSGSGYYYMGSLNADATVFPVVYSPLSPPVSDKSNPFKLATTTNPPNPALFFYDSSVGAIAYIPFAYGCVKPTDYMWISADIGSPWYNWQGPQTANSFIVNPDNSIIVGPSLYLAVQNGVLGPLSSKYSQWVFQKQAPATSCTAPNWTCNGPGTCAMTDQGSSFQDYATCAKACVPTDCPQHVGSPLWNKLTQTLFLTPCTCEECGTDCSKASDQCWFSGGQLNEKWTGGKGIGVHVLAFENSTLKSYEYDGHGFEGLGDDCNVNCLPNPYDLNTTNVTSVTVLEEFGDSTCLSKNTITCNSSDPSCVRPCCAKGGSVYINYPVLRQCISDQSGKTWYGFYQNYPCPKVALYATITNTSCCANTGVNPPGATGCQQTCDGGVDVTNVDICKNIAGWGKNSIITNFNIYQQSDSQDNNGVNGIHLVQVCDYNSLLLGSSTAHITDTTSIYGMEYHDKDYCCGLTCPGIGDYPTNTDTTSYTYGLYKIITYTYCKVIAIELFYRDTTGKLPDIHTCFGPAGPNMCTLPVCKGSCTDQTIPQEYRCEMKEYSQPSGSGTNWYITNINLGWTDGQSHGCFYWGITRINSVDFIGVQSNCGLP